MTKPPRLPYCPRCDSVMTELQSDSTHFLGCKNCGGAFLDTAAASRVCTRMSEEQVAAAQELTQNARVNVDLSRTNLPCPMCDRTLVLTYVADGNVPVDVCLRHGTWFDAGEIETIAGAVDDRRRRARPTEGARATSTTRPGMSLTDGPDAESMADATDGITSTLKALVRGLLDR